MDEFENNELISVAMQIILRAGDALNCAFDALKSAKAFDFETADQLMKEAEENILAAHKSQTTIIQKEASGDSYDYCLLFTHAQDTLMTINSEIKLTYELIDILKMMKEKLG